MMSLRLNKSNERRGTCDAELATFDTYFDRSVADVIKELPRSFAKGADDLLELAYLQAAFAHADSYDAAFAEAIVNLGHNCGKQFSAEDTTKKIKAMRRQFR